MCGHGSPGSSAGASIHLYQFDKGMGNQFFYSADSEIMLVPYEGELVVDTEYGVIACQPKEIIVVPRGCKFQVNGRQKSKEGRYCGYMIENFGAPFQLPELGPIGANGLANARDFKIPVARYQDQTLSCQLICKFEGSFYSASMEHHPLNVVAWHGNYYPYKYDLTRFNTIGSVSFDHPDPSIFTVLTSPTERTGFANVDFVIFPERWMVAENTFRPPYYHRNLMSEFMGLIEGIYDAKPSGFVKGGGSLHNRMSAHGPDRDSFEHATTSELRPEKQTQTLGFMWESLGVWSVTDQALSAEFRQRDYVACWKGLESRFQK
jgi:homogentisate 1,2-dioxygenase